MSTIKRFTAKHPALVYFALTFAISWGHRSDPPMALRPTACLFLCARRRAVIVAPALAVANRKEISRQPLRRQAA